MIVLKQNDTLPVVKATIKDSDSVAINLTGCTATFNLSNEYGTLKFSKAAVITNATTGSVEYRWSGLDTDTVGKFKGEFKITFPDTKRLTAPNGDYIVVQVFKELV